MRTRTRTETCGRRSGVSKPLLLMLMRMPWRRRRSLRSCLQWRRSPPVAVPPNSQQPPFRSDRFFFFLFFSGRPNPIFPFRNLRKQREQNSSVQHPKRAQFECTEKPRCRKWPHLRDQRVNERLPSNAIFGRPRTGAGAEGGKRSFRRLSTKTKGCLKVSLHLGVRTAATLVTSGPHDDGAHPRCGNPDPWYNLFSRCR